MGTGRLSTAAANQSRDLVAIGASQVDGPSAGLAELAHLDADPARVGPVDADGLSCRGMIRLLAGGPGPGLGRPDRRRPAGAPRRHLRLWPACLLGSGQADQAAAVLDRMRAV